MQGVIKIARRSLLASNSECCIDNIICEMLFTIDNNKLASHRSMSSPTRVNPSLRKYILPAFHIIKLYSIVHIHIYVNESSHICVPRFINIYMNVGNARKFYNLKRR